MDDSLRDALAVLMRQFFDELPVVQQYWAAWARGKRVLVVGHGRAAACS